MRQPEYVFYVNVGRRTLNEAKRHLAEIRDQMDEIFGEGRVLVLERKGDSVIKVLNPNKSNRPWSMFCEILGRFCEHFGENQLAPESQQAVEEKAIRGIAELAFNATALFEEVEERRTKELFKKPSGEDNEEE